MSVQDPPSRFIVSRPDEQSNLTPEIPKGEIPTHYINRYHADHDVSCAFCDKHTLHRKGFTAEMADGRIALCGRDCAIVRRQGFWDRWLPELIEGVAHLVAVIMRRHCGEASAGFRLSFV